jgi:monomeric sarcosine oxidase
MGPEGVPPVRVADALGGVAMSGPTVVVVGAGVMGLGAGAALAEAGANVTVLERYHVAHDWASSHGLSRAIRHEYGPLAQYSEMVARSLILWDELARETVRRLYIETGVLTLGQPDDGHTLPGLEVMRAQGLPVERLSADECERRFPQFRAGDFAAITWNPRGGMLRATECCLALAERIRARGGTISEEAQVMRVEPYGDGGRVWLASGEMLTADRVVVAAGSWIADVLPDLTIPVRVSRQQVCYFSGLDEKSFGVGHFPVFLSGMNQYGFPMHGPGWLKVGLHDFGATVDPNAGYEPDINEVEAVRDFLRAYIPGAAQAELAGVDRCMYDVTGDEDFILDYHPGGRGVVIASGFSGHGFKFGIVVGRLLCALALETEPEFSLERFRLDRFIHEVYP